MIQWYCYRVAASNCAPVLLSVVLLPCCCKCYCRVAAVLMSVEMLPVVLLPVVLLPRCWQLYCCRGYCYPVVASSIADSGISAVWLPIVLLPVGFLEGGWKSECTARCYRQLDTFLNLIIRINLLNLVLKNVLNLEICNLSNWCPLCSTCPRLSIIFG